MPKNNERIWRTLRITLLLGILVVSVAMAYSALNHQVESNTTTIEKHEVKLDKHQTALTQMGKDIEYIKKGVDKIQAKLE